MDRNPGAAAGEYRGRTVALRKEGVDRNINQGKETRDFSRVALRKEGVDRNSMYHNTTPADMQSLSARRAWIEMISAIAPSISRTSLSARRAWIEMLRPPACSLPAECRSPQGEHGMFLFLTVQGGFVHADIRFNFKNCYSKKLSHKII